jgi:hypothetical protein
MCQPRGRNRGTGGDEGHGRDSRFGTRLPLGTPTPPSPLSNGIMGLAGFFRFGL